jgi:hypothetical protein
MIHAEAYAGTMHYLKAVEATTKVRTTIPAEQAFRPIHQGDGPLVKK